MKNIHVLDYFQYLGEGKPILPYYRKLFNRVADLVEENKKCLDGFVINSDSYVKCICDHQVFGSEILIGILNKKGITNISIKNMFAYAGLNGDKQIQEIFEDDINYITSEKPSNAFVAFTLSRNSKLNENV